jgi:hypothetical protein
MSGEERKVKESGSTRNGTSSNITFMMQLLQNAHALRSDGQGRSWSMRPERSRAYTHHAGFWRNQTQTTECGPQAAHGSAAINGSYCVLSPQKRSGDFPPSCGHEQG